jgi:hypothetical protein
MCLSNLALASISLQRDRYLEEKDVGKYGRA